MIKVQHLKPELLSFFCLLCAERMQGIYQTFIQKFPDIEFNYQAALDKGYALINSSNKAELLSCKDYVEEFIHDSDDYIPVIADQAQCSIICLFCAIEYSVSADVDCAMEAIQKIDEGIDIYGCEVGNATVYERQESDWQKELFNILVSLDRLPNHEETQVLRKRNVEYMLPAVT